MWWLAMVRNPYRWRATIPQMENRHATAGCLLSVLFTVPYLIKTGQFSLILIAAGVSLYVALVVPLLTGILSCRSLLYYVRLILITACNVEFWKDMGFFTLFLINWSHFLYLQMSTAHATIMQVMFNLAAEKLFCPNQRLCCLYVLLFYCVIAYLQRSLHLWSQQNTTAELVKLTTVFMIVRLGKAVVMTLMLLTISVQFRHMEPPIDYVVLTLFYFCLSQYKGELELVKSVVSWLTQLKLHWLEGMEDLVAPFMLDAAITAVGAIIGAALLATDNYFVLFIFSYTNIAVPFIQMQELTWNPLSQEWHKLNKFEFALWNHPEVRNAGLCAICLDKLEAITSRITPCGHVFHGICLRRSLNYTPWCPLCKNPL